MNEIQIEEYRFLREELKSNRKLVFERPLIIAGVTFATALSLSKGGLLGVIPLPFLLILVFNLWFTMNRLRSSARIIAYIQLTHEGESTYKWNGWENALRMHRDWQAQPDTPCELEGRDNFKLYDHLAYYPGIYYFHLLLGLMIVIVILGQSSQFAAVINDTANKPAIVQLAANGVFAFLFTLLHFWFRPGKLRHGIETNRQIWAAVLENNSVVSGRTIAQPKGLT